MKYPLDIAECHKIIREQQAKIDEQAEELRAWADYDAGTGNAVLIQWAETVRRVLKDHLKYEYRMLRLGTMASAARILVAAAAIPTPTNTKLNIWNVAKTIAFYKSANFYNDRDPVKDLDVLLVKARACFRAMGFDDPFITGHGGFLTLTPAAREWVNQYKPDVFKRWTETLPKVAPLPDFLKNDVVSGLAVFVAAILWGFVFMGLAV